MNTTIHATVNPRLLQKASRLFTGTLAGRIAELLQNARRAGATHVQITNATDGRVTVRDNGGGVRDFAVLLDLGGSGWPPPSSPESDLENSEDPAGVGLFCLAPREVLVRSGGLRARIEPEGWTGRGIEVQPDPEALPAVKPGIAQGAGTELSFPDEPWEAHIVKSLAVFTGLEVTVDEEPLPKEQFLAIRGGARGSRTAPYRALGCRIKVVPETSLSPWHRPTFESGSYRPSVLVNFHGQVVGFEYQPVSLPNLRYLVDLTGAPTALRLMLPARTQLIDNPALHDLKTALEREGFLYVQRQGAHQLPYQDYVRAQELGIALPEAQPTYQVGLLTGDGVLDPVQVVQPKDFPLARCHRLDPDYEGDESDEANAHLLAALGRLDPPFVPVHIHSRYEGYSWAKLPLVRQVELAVGKSLLEAWVWSGQILCVDHLAITVQTSAGQRFSSPVCMAVKPAPERGYCDCEVYVTPEAQGLDAHDLWYHLGGWSDDSDSFDTQEREFSQQLDDFWARLVGPDEPLRTKLLDCLASLEPAWRSVTILRNGCVTLHFQDGTERTILPPSDALRSGLEARP